MAFPNLGDWSKGRNTEVKTKPVLAAASSINNFRGYDRGFIIMLMLLSYKTNPCMQIQG